VNEPEQLAIDKEVTAAQPALAWILAKGDNIVPISKTRRSKYLQENISATEISLTHEEIERLETIFSPGVVAGER